MRYRVIGKIVAALAFKTLNVTFLFVGITAPFAYDCFSRYLADGTFCSRNKRKMRYKSYGSGESWRIDALGPFEKSEPNNIFIICALE